MKGCALPGTAFGPDATAVLANDRFADAETQPQATARRAVDLKEALEDVRQVLGRNARSIVTDTELYVTILLRSP